MRLNVETAENLCEKYGITLEHGHYVVATRKCGCAIGLLSVAATDDIEVAEDMLENAFLWSDVSELTGESEAYLVGLEAGFEGWPVERDELDDPMSSEDWRNGYLDGARIATAGEDGLLPMVNESGWEGEMSHMNRKEVLAQIEKVEMLALIPHQEEDAKV